MNFANHESQTYRAPNGKYYAIWRGQPVCALAGVLLYFDTERDAEEFTASPSKVIATASQKSRQSRPAAPRS